MTPPAADGPAPLRPADVALAPGHGVAALLTVAEILGDVAAAIAPGRGVAARTAQAAAVLGCVPLVRAAALELAAARPEAPSCVPDGAFDVVQSLATDAFLDAARRLAAREAASAHARPDLLIGRPLARRSVSRGAGRTR